MSGDNFTFDDAMRSAIIQYFFEDPPVQYIPGADGQMLPITNRPSPLRKLADEIIRANQVELIQRVVDKIDIDQLADLLAEKITTAFEREMKDALSNRSTWNAYHAPTWWREVNDTAKRLVSAELADRMMKTMDAEEAAREDKKETT